MRAKRTHLGSRWTFDFSAALILVVLCAIPALGQQTPPPKYEPPSTAKPGVKPQSSPSFTVTSDLPARRPITEQQPIHPGSPGLPANSDRLCLAVDGGKPIVVPPVQDGMHQEASGTYYPAVAVTCGAFASEFTNTWTASDSRELQITVHGQPMCLSARYIGSFTPLIAPLLAAFHATQAGSSFAYLTGAADPGLMKSNPILVASICRRHDAVDFWSYDYLSGTISGPAGNPLGSRKCVAIDGDATTATAGASARYASGMPVYAMDCSDINARYGQHPADASHWSISAGAGKASLPTYPAPAKGDYFSGVAGLPITGPMGRCLTADSVTPGAVVTSDCDGRYEQDWKMSGTAIQLGNSSDCLSAEADGTVDWRTCSQSANQAWVYVVRYPDASPQWTKDPVAYGLIQPSGDSSKCLSVADYPFTDPMQQRNPVKVVGCNAVSAIQESWFRPTRVLTVRLGLLRYSNDDGTNVPTPTLPDQCKPSSATPPPPCATSIMEAMAAKFSTQFHALGLRFVFDPDSDLQTVKDTIANKYDYYSVTPPGAPTTDCSSQPCGVTSYIASDHINGAASSKMYGKMAIAFVAGHPGGDMSSGDFVEYQPSLIVDPVTSGLVPDYTSDANLSQLPILSDYVNDPTVPRDPAGLPALSYFALASGLAVAPTDVMPHEIGHYLSLQHTFNYDEFSDTPHDTGDGTGWTNLGTTSCGNPRAAAIGGNPFNNATVTPDRLNNEGYFGCFVGRAHNVFSPLQAARATWVLNNQMNRYPLVACQPLGAYDADHVECENAASLALCQQTAAYLASTASAAMSCQRGGFYARAIAKDLSTPEIQSLLRNSAAGKKLMNKLAGGDGSATAITDAQFKAVTAALEDCVNLPLTMAMVNRFRAYERGLVTTKAPAPPFSPLFIKNVPPFYKAKDGPNGLQRP